MIEEISSKLADKLELTDWHQEMVVGSMGFSGTIKMILTLKSSRKTQKFFVKSSTTPNLSSFLIQETRTMELLHSKGISGIPKVVLSGKVGEKSFLVEEFIDGMALGRRSLSQERHLASAIAWMKTLYAKTNGGEIMGNDLVRRSESRLDVISEFFDVEDAISMLEKLVPQVPIPVSYIHGDFGPNNMMLGSNGNLLVFDFSWSSPHEPPLDLLDLIDESDGAASLIARMGVLNNINPIFLLLYHLIRRTALSIRDYKLTSTAFLSDYEIQRLQVAKSLKRVLLSHRTGNHPKSKGFGYSS